MSDMPSTNARPLRKERLDRLGEADRKPLRNNTLVGSYFHEMVDDDEYGEVVRWQGCVVAEPAPAVYLVELFEWIVGSSSCQKLVWLEDMRKWQFYDDAKWMQGEYEHGSAGAGNRQRARREDAKLKVAMDADDD
jgi:hypothetical protein